MQKLCQNLTTKKCIEVNDTYDVSNIFVMIRFGILVMLTFLLKE